MRSFYLTAFNKNGEKLLDESFTAENNREAKKVGTGLLESSGFEKETHRCVTSNGKLILFHR